MTIYNVSVPVVANIDAASEQEAVTLLVRALDQAGFMPYEPEREAQAFEAEQDPDTIGGLPEPPPSPFRPWEGYRNH